MITQPKPLPTTNAPQEGFVLIVGLVILGLLTMLALSGMRDSTMQEKMAGASRDSGLAFQAAESALRDAENCITGATANCEFTTAEAAHFSKDDPAFPEHNNLFNATTWNAFDPPGDPTALAGVPPDGANSIIRQAGTIAGAGHFFLHGGIAHAAQRQNGQQTQNNQADNQHKPFLGRIRCGQRLGLSDHSSSLIPEGNGTCHDFV